MDGNDIVALRREFYRVRAAALAEAMEMRNFEVHVCGSGGEARELALGMMPEGSSVAWGGSATISQIGLIDAVRKGGYLALDRDAASSPEERERVLRDAFSADFYLTSFNSVQMDGTVYNADGQGNRVAAITFGPKNVIAVVGMNKVCLSEESAMERATGEAAEINAVRFGRGDTLFTEGDITDDVPSQDRICNFLEKIAWCRGKGRIKVILVCEDLGF